MSRYQVTFEVDYDSEDTDHSLMEKVRAEIKETRSVNSQQLSDLEEDDVRELILDELTSAFTMSQRGRTPPTFSRLELTGVVSVPQ